MMARLDKLMRKRLAIHMSDSGMSTRAIAGVLMVSQKTIDRDLVDWEFDTATVVGLDGREYLRRKKAA
jgi:transposase